MTTTKLEDQLAPCPFCGYDNFLSPVSHMAMDSSSFWVVDDAMVERAWIAYVNYRGNGISMLNENGIREDMRAALEAALQVPPANSPASIEMSDKTEATSVTTGSTRMFPPVIHDMGEVFRGH